MPDNKIIQPLAINLGHVAAKYGIKSLGDFLFQPLRVRSAGRMPDMKLTPAESLSIARYLSGDRPQAEKALVPDAAMVAAGSKYFKELNCAACHSLGAFKAAPVVGSLSNADSQGSGPRFHLGDAQVEAIIAAAQEKPTTDTDRIVVAKTMTAFNGGNTSPFTLTGGTLQTSGTFGLGGAGHAAR